MLLSKGDVYWLCLHIGDKLYAFYWDHSLLAAPDNKNGFWDTYIEEDWSSQDPESRSFFTCFNGCRLEVAWFWVDNGFWFPLVHKAGCHQRRQMPSWNYMLHILTLLSVFCYWHFFFFYNFQVIEKNREDAIFLNSVVHLNMQLLAQIFLPLITSFF